MVKTDLVVEYQYMFINWFMHKARYPCRYIMRANFAAETLG